MKDERVLFLILSGEWYWKIYSGEKCIEYRAKSPRNARIIKRHYDWVRFQLGYTKKNVMTYRIEKIIETDEFYEIHLIEYSQSVESYTEPTKVITASDITDKEFVNSKIKQHETND